MIFVEKGIFLLCSESGLAKSNIGALTTAQKVPSEIFNSTTQHKEAAENDSTILLNNIQLVPCIAVELSIEVGYIRAKTTEQVTSVHVNITKL